MAQHGPAADINLLFGILALQLDFITRDQLIAAMSAWVFDKNKALSAILVKHGALAEDRHVLLQALVREHLNKHENDPQRSLAALGPVGFVQADLEKLGDPLLQASLVHVSTTTPRAGNEDPFATVAGAVGTPTTPGQRFRILRPHARGGLGEVYVALDEELHREVALKEIREVHADDADSRARFLLEAEITGGLEHPGIVPVYGLGQYADGRPYYAMRFIRGDSFQEAIERFHKADTAARDPGERTLALSKLLGQFINVCQTIQYAHDRGVLHRDLKPANIMLGKYGATLVVDWGLAKLLGKEEAVTPSAEAPLRPSPKLSGNSAETLSGSALGTPQYMSPEQAEGRLDLLGPASDIYSLGATLYCLLTGQAPFEDADLGTILQKVQRGDFPRPRQLKRLVPPALEAICLKAMALQPRDRFASSAQMAGEIEHWLADEPVNAWREPWSQRTARWARRHRFLVEAFAGVLVVLIATMMVTALWQQQEAAKERDARIAVEKRRGKGLLVAAQSAARTIAYLIDQRWYILLGAAEDAEIRRLLQDLEKIEQPREPAANNQALLDWLTVRALSSTRNVSSSWIITDQRGLVLARYPPNEHLVGRNVAFRDYFHGLGKEFPEGTVKEPITDRHRSLVFINQVTRKPSVAFSVPIWRGQPRGSQCIGVLIMTLEISELARLKLLLPDEASGELQDHEVALVDTRDDWIDGQPQRGLFLYHPSFAERLKTNSGTLPVIRMDEARLARLEKVRQSRLKPALKFSDDSVDFAYTDPVDAADTAPWLAAFAPVLIGTQPTKYRDNGWMVILQVR